ncbi:MAG: hypothetical protein K6T75_09380 [Acetobacteraceae bacterium]|nr:hypothetical protein [Acetobacteraceae bacterium]
MRVLAFGAGAVGSLLGGRLAASGHQVVLLARAPHARAVSDRGLEIRGPGDEVLRARPGAEADPARALQALGRPDLVLFTVKGYDVPAAAGELARALSALLPGGAGAKGGGGGPAGLPWVLVMANGVGHEEVVSQAVGRDRVLAGALTASTTLPEPGVVVQHTRGGLALAPMRGCPAGPDLAVLAGHLGTAGFRVRLAPDHLTLKWSKLMLNLWTNATCAILDLSPSQVFFHPRVFALEREAFREGLRVMRRLGAQRFDFPGGPLRLLAALSSLPGPLLRRLMARRGAAGRGAKLPSLLIDIRAAKRRSEVGFLNGAIARKARELGLRAPVNAALFRVLDGMFQGRVGREEFRGQPQRLLEEVARQRASWPADPGA